MLRQSSSRNHRSKGLKLKKALQITLLVLVSVWLLYQVKHSYEKEKSYSEDEANDLHKDDKNHEEIVRLGRKDLPTRMDADSSTLDERTEDEENDEMEQEMKHDENDEDPIDEQDLDKDNDLPEPGEHSSDKDGDDVGVFEDEERKERSQEDQEKNFHGDNVVIMYLVLFLMILHHLCKKSCLIMPKRRSCSWMMLQLPCLMKNSRLDMRRKCARLGRRVSEVMMCQVPWIMIPR